MNLEEENRQLKKQVEELLAQLSVYTQPKQVVSQRVEKPVVESNDNYFNLLTYCSTCDQRHV